MLPITVALALAGICCIVAAYFCHFYYTLYQQTHTELQVNMDGQIDSLRQEVARLARQKHFRPIRARGWLSTTDLQPDESHGYTTNTITLGQSKTGWVIAPELRLRSGSTDLQEYKIRLRILCIFQCCASRHSCSTITMSMRPSPNNPNSAKPAIAVSFHVDGQWCGFAGRGR